MAAKTMKSALNEVKAKVVCPHDCPDACSIIAHIVDGQLMAVSGDPDHPTTRGFLCPKVQPYVEQLYSDDRVLTPLKRLGSKNEGQFGSTSFAPISWDEALDTIAERFKEIIAGGEANAILPYNRHGSKGILNAGSMDQRFFNRLGAARVQEGLASAWDRGGYEYTVGAAVGIDPEAATKSRLIIIWSNDTATSNTHQMPVFLKAKNRGARIVVIDPRRTRTAEMADEYLQIRPGTDGALALAIMNVIIAKQMVDKQFIAASTVGYEQLTERVKDYSPEKVAEIVGLDAQAIRRLALQYATIQPSLIRIGKGLRRQVNGEMAMRAVACLPALVGAWRYLGGGALYSNSGLFPLDVNALRRPDLLHGEPRTVNIDQLDAALLADSQPIRALYIYNCSTAAADLDQGKMPTGLSREDLFTVAHATHLTGEAKHADIVLPAPSQFEQMDLFKSDWHCYLQLSQPAIRPVGQARSSFTVFKLLAQRMGFAEPCFDDSQEAVVEQALASGHPYLEGVTMVRLRSEGWVRANVAAAPFASGVFPTPSGRIELYSEAMRQAGFDPLPQYAPAEDKESPE